MKVSVIVPVYNTEKYLEKCLDSIVNQTYKDIEIIVINDGSTDNSFKIINKYVDKYPNIVYKEITNHGQGYARNLGIKLSSGDYIMFLDSDDYVNVDIISKMINKIGTCDVVVCDIYKVIGNELVNFKNYYNYFKDNINLMLSHPGPVAKLYKKEVIKNVSFLENVYYEDLSFTPVISLNVNKVCYINEYLYYYVIHANSTMLKKEFNEKINSIFKVMDYLKDKLKSYPEELEYLHIEHLLYSATLRYLDYDNTQKYLKKINDIMIKYPNWRKNKYYKMKSYKFKLVCYLAYKKRYKILKLLKKVSGKI